MTSVDGEERETGATPMEGFLNVLMILTVIIILAALAVPGLSDAWDKKCCAADADCERAALAAAQRFLSGPEAWDRDANYYYDAAADRVAACTTPAGPDSGYGTCAIHSHRNKFLRVEINPDTLEVALKWIFRFEGNNVVGGGWNNILCSTAQ